MKTIELLTELCVNENAQTRTCVMCGKMLKPGLVLCVGKCSNQDLCYVWENAQTKTCVMCGKMLKPGLVLCDGLPIPGLVLCVGKYPNQDLCYVGECS